MIRQPVPWPATWPLCYGLAHAATAPVCQACPMQEPCAVHTGTWAGPSLAEAVARVNAVVSSLGGLPTDPDALYGRLYLKHFGQPPRVDRSPMGQPRQARLTRALAKAVALCRTHRLDLPIFVSAQMVAFTRYRDRLPTRVRQFPVEWLGGPRAVERYTCFRQMAKRLYGEVGEDAFALQTQVGRLHARLSAEEHRVAEAFCLRWRREGAADWQAACDSVSPSLDWRALEAGPGGTDPAVRQQGALLTGRLGAAACRTLKASVQLHAAAALAEQAQSGLPARVGFRLPWSWPSFARLLTHLCGALRTRPFAPVDLAGVGGTWWRAHARR